MLIRFNKPYGVLSQFTPEGRWTGLIDHIDLPGVYVAGRLDADSEGLLLLTDDGKEQARIADPRFKMEKTYLVQVEGFKLFKIFELPEIPTTSPRNNIFIE